MTYRDHEDFVTLPADRRSEGDFYPSSDHQPIISRKFDYLKALKELLPGDDDLLDLILRTLEEDANPAP